MDVDKIISELMVYKKHLDQDVVGAFKNGPEYGRERYERWRKRFTKFLNDNLPGESKRLNSKLYREAFVVLKGETEADRFLREYGKIIYAFIDSLKEDLKHGLYEPPEEVDNETSIKEIQDYPLVALKTIFSRFHSVVRALRNRHAGRPTLDVKDEYDVQDLLYALLSVEFKDIRSEEWTPSYAGKCSRVDFLLKKEKIVLEVKMTRNGLTDKEVGDQLIVDIERYKQHRDCKKLICFIYDPEGRIVNKAGIQNDLKSQAGNQIDVEVFIYPE